MSTTEWQVWFVGDDGHVRTMDSRQGAWADLPGRLLVVRYWNSPLGDGLNWGDGLYGDPATHKTAGMTSDEAFADAMAEASRTTVRPSKR